MMNIVVTMISFIKDLSILLTRVTAWYNFTGKIELFVFPLADEDFKVKIKAHFSNDLLPQVRQK